MQKFTRALIAAAIAAAWFTASAPASKADVSYYTPPKFKHQVMPVYPDSARAKNEQGTVTVKVLVAPNGEPKQFILFKSSGHKDLDDAVMAAVKASTYIPAMRGSTPVIGFLDVSYRMTLNGVAENEGAQNDLAKKLEANPKDVTTRIALGTDYLNLKKWSNAEQLFQDGVQAVPDSAKLWAYLGLSYYQDAEDSQDASKYKPAADAYDKALALDPKVETSNVAPSVYFNEAFHLQQTNDNAGALPYAQKAVALAPKEFLYDMLLGEVQTGLSNYADAIQSLKKSESLDDKKSPMLTSRILADEGLAELSQGDKTNGMADINRAEQAQPRAIFAYEYLYSYYFKSGNQTAALTPLNQLELLQPKEVAWPLRIADVYLRQGNVVAAKQAFQKAQAIDPNNTEVQFGLAEIAIAGGDSSTVDATMQKITANAAPAVAAGYEARLAIDYLNASQNGKTYYTQAQNYATQATKADPTNGQAWFALGYAEAQQKNKDSANVALKKAYDIFKAQNDQVDLKQVSDLYKQLNGSDIGG